MMLNQVIRETESEKERKTKKESEKAKKTSCGSAGVQRVERESEFN